MQHWGRSKSWASRNQTSKKKVDSGDTRKPEWKTSQKGREKYKINWSVSTENKREYKDQEDVHASQELDQLCCMKSALFRTPFILVIADLCSLVPGFLTQPVLKPFVPGCHRNMYTFQAMRPSFGFRKHEYCTNTANMLLWLQESYLEEECSRNGSQAWVLESQISVTLPFKSIMKSNAWVFLGLVKAKQIIQMYNKSYTWQQKL